jgi:hypothetical protein
MATPTKKRKGNNGDVTLNKTEELVRTIFENLTKEQRGKNICDIARMVAENNKERNLVQLANMVKNNGSNRLASCRRNAENRYRIDNCDIREIAELVRSNKNISVTQTTFSVKQIRTHERFGYFYYFYYDTTKGQCVGSTQWGTL